MKRRLLSPGVALGVIALSACLVVPSASNPLSAPLSPNIGSSSSGVLSSSTQQRTTDTDHIVVSFAKPGLASTAHTKGEIRRAVASITTVPISTLDSGGARTLSVRLSKSVSRTQALRIAQAIQTIGGVDYAEPSVNVYPDATVAPTVPDYGWHLKAIEASKAWASTNGESDGAGIVVGVIDTGIGANPALPKTLVVKPTRGDVIEGTTWPGLTVTLRAANLSTANLTATTQADSAGNWSYTVLSTAMLPDKTPVTVSVSDTSTGIAASNAPVTTATVTVDTSIVVDVPSPINTNTFAGTTDPFATVSIANSSAQQVCTTTADKDGKFSCTVSTDVALGSEADFSLTATDPAGNRVTKTVRIDKLAPQAPTVAASNGSIVQVSGIETGAGSKVVDTQDNFATVDGTWTGSATDTSRSFTPTARLNNSTDRYQVVITDPAGNEAAQTFSVDTIAPALTAVSPSTGDTLAGTAEVGAVVTVAWSATVHTQATVGDDGRWSLAKPTQVDLTTGQVLAVVAADPVGNETSASVLIDRTPPPTPIVHATDGAVLSGMTEAHARVAISYTDADSGSHAVTTQADGDGVWTATLDPRAGDRTKLTVTAADSLGNTSTTASVTVHYGPPSAPSVSPSDGKTVVISGILDGDTAALVNAQGDSVNAECRAGAQSTWTCTPSVALTESSAVFAVAIDDAHNVSARTAVIVDTTAPVLTVTAVSATGITMEANEAVQAPSVTYHDQAGAEHQVTASDSAGTWTATFDPAATAGSPLSLTAQDMVGNRVTMTVSVPAAPSATPSPSPPAAEPNSVPQSIITPTLVTAPSTTTSGEVAQRADTAGNTVAGTVLPGYDVLDSDADATATTDKTYTDRWHGTHVAGIVAATHTEGLSQGVAPGAKILPIRVLGTGKSGHVGDTDDVAKAIKWGAGVSDGSVPANPTPANVLNLSLSAGNSSTPVSCPKNLQDAITAATKKGVAVVVSAGNLNSSIAAVTPANCSGVIVVTATTNTNARASYSNWGSSQTPSAHLIAAPGGSGIPDGTNFGWFITSTINGPTPVQDPVTLTWSDSNWAALVGTSQAAPQVSATVALMMAKAARSGISSYTPQSYANILENTASGLTDGCPTGICGYGLLNTGDAVNAIGATSPDSGLYQPPKAAFVYPTLMTVRTWPSVIRTGTRLTAPQGSSYSYSTRYAWYRSGQSSPIAYGLTYSATGLDYGKTLSVLATSPANGASLFSRAPRAVTTGYLTSRTLPTISGTVKVGRRLSVSKGTWSAYVSAYKYQWYRNGKAIRGASRSRYTLTRSDRGARIQARVWVKSTGYYSTSRYSVKTIAVRR